MNSVRSRGGNPSALQYVYRLQEDQVDGRVRGGSNGGGGGGRGGVLTQNI